MLSPPNLCLFCSTREGPFTRSEHPIPESLGNDDHQLPPGFVCDSCNQYFGSKVEKPILEAPPFSIERARAGTRTKKGRLPRHTSKDFSLYATGFWDHLILDVRGPRSPFFASPFGEVLVPPESPPAALLARFLLKIGLELLATDHTSYQHQFDAARRCARYGNHAESWQVAFGIYPDSQDLVISTRTDDIGPLETRQIYQYSIGQLPDGDVVFSFAYAVHIFACNLSRPTIVEYIRLFNPINKVALQVY